jgi:hypothetical protein
LYASIASAVVTVLVGGAVGAATLVSLVNS